MLLAGLCVLFVAEKKDLFRPRSRGRGAVFGESLRQLGRTVRQTAADPGLKSFVLMGAAGMAAYGTVEEFDTLYGLHVGVPAAFIGLWGGALRFAVVAIGAALASLASFLTTGAGMGLGILLGLAAEHWGLPALFRGGAVLSIASMAIYAALTARRKQALRTKARREG